MGFLDRFSRRQEQQGDVGFFGRVDRLGMTILNDEKLMARLGVYEEMHAMMRHTGICDPEHGLDTIEAQVHAVSDTLHQVAIPFGRAGSEKWYAEIMRGWSTLYTVMLDIVHSARSLLERGDAAGWHGSEAGRRELIGKVWNFFQNVYMRYALLIAEISWFHEDVSPSWSTVIMPPMGGMTERGLTTYQVPRDLNEEIQKED